MTTKKLTDHSNGGQILEMYTIFDKKADTHMRPMYVPHIIEIQRNLTKNLQDPESTLAQFPEDYALWKLGTYNLKTAQYVIEPKPQFICNITDMMESPSKPKPEARI